MASARIGKTPKQVARRALRQALPARAYRTVVAAYQKLAGQPRPASTATGYAVFEDIYEHDGWRHGSGSGSLIETTGTYRALLQRLLVERGVHSVVDFGCGDWQFSRLIDWTGITYTGYDVAKSVIAADTLAYSKENVRLSIWPIPRIWTNSPPQICSLPRTCSCTYPYPRSNASWTQPSPSMLGC
jgi:hypothetical protein